MENNIKPENLGKYKNMLNKSYDIFDVNYQYEFNLVENSEQSKLLDEFRNLFIDAKFKGIQELAHERKDEIMKIEKIDIRETLLEQIIISSFIMKDVKLLNECSNSLNSRNVNKHLDLGILLSVKVHKLFCSK